MRFDQALDDRQTETRTFVGGDNVVTTLSEVLKDAELVFRRDTDAGVRNSEVDAAVANAAREGRDAAPALGELGGIGEQVEEDLLDRSFVAINQRQVPFDLDLKLATGRVEFGSHHGAGAGDCRCEIQIAFAECPASGFDLGKIEDVVDQGQEMEARAMNEFG